MPLALGPLVLVSLVVILALVLWAVLPPERFFSPWRRTVDAFAAQHRAEQTARHLLQANLPAEQYETLQQRGYLEVPSPSHPGRVYRIPYGAGRVAVYDNERFAMSLCVQPTTWLPNGDLVLMHKLHIEANEEQYLQTANQLRYG